MPVLCVPGVDRLKLARRRLGAPTNSYEIATTTQPGKIVIVQAASPQLRGGDMSDTLVTRSNSSWMGSFLVLAVDNRKRVPG